MLAIGNEDYTVVLQYYGINTINLMPHELREKATHILATKLCKCTNNLSTSKDNLKCKDGLYGHCKVILKH